MAELGNYNIPANTVESEKQGWQIQAHSVVYLIQFHNIN